MRKSILLVIALVLTFALVFTACAVGEEKIIIRLAHEDPPDNQWGMGATHFAELVSKKPMAESRFRFLTEVNLDMELTTFSNCRQLSWK